jgi:cysteinyl-tRNA synthetase
MSMSLLGAHFDLHTGGVDHRELHHVNEIAQSEAYLGDGLPWVRYWLHNEFLQLGTAKMAKSAGSAPRITDLVESGRHPIAFRLFLLGGHYRAQLDFTPAAVDSAQATLRRLLIRSANGGNLPTVETLAEALGLAADDQRALALLDQVDAAVSADLNTPQLLAILQEALRDGDLTAHGRRTVVAACDALLGLALDRITIEELDGRADRPGLDPSTIAAVERMVAERSRARQEGDWGLADRLRSELDALGVHVTDTPTGPTWDVR